MKCAGTPSRLAVEGELPLERLEWKKMAQEGENGFISSVDGAPRAEMGEEREGEWTRVVLFWE